MVVAVARHDPLVVLRGLEEPLEEVARDVHVLAELPDREASRHADGVATARPRGRRVKAGQLGDRELLLLGDHVVADRVVNPGALPRVQPLVVARVVPREHGRIHRLVVEGLHVLDRRLRRLGVDRDRLAVLGDVLGAVAPEDRVERRDRVGGLADGEPDGMAELLELAPGAEEVLPGVGLALADLLEQVDPVTARERGEHVRHAEPLPFDLGMLLGERVPVPVLLREVVADIGYVGQTGLEEPGVVHLQADDVVARLAHDLRRQLGGHLHALDVIDPDIDAGGLREPLGELGQFRVRGGCVIDGGQEAQLARGPACRRPAGRENPGHPRQRPSPRSEDGAPPNVSTAGSEAGKVPAIAHRPPPRGRLYGAPGCLSIVQ